MSRLKSVKANLSFRPTLEDYLTVYTSSLVYNVAKRAKTIVKLVGYIVKSFIITLIRFRIEPIWAGIYHRLPGLGLNLDYVLDLTIN